MKSKVISKILFTLTLGLVLLIVPNLVFEISILKTINPNAQVLFRSILGCSLVLIGIFLLRKYFDIEHPKSIGVGSISKGVYNFCFGLSLIVFPFTVTLIISDVFQWAEVNYHIDNLLDPAYLITLLSTLLLEAIPEEFIYRGYLYSNLNTTYNRLKSSLLTIILFVITPPISVLLSSIIFTNDVNSTNFLNPSYIVWLLIFGTFVQYLRVITNNIWAGVGFHLIFVYMNKTVGQSPNNVVQLSKIMNEPASQITMGVCLLITMLVLILYPKLTPRKISIR